MFIFFWKDEELRGLAEETNQFVDPGLGVVKINLPASDCGSGDQ